jgi:hypothetical protein
MRPYRACAGKTSAAEDVAYYKRNVQIEEKLPNEVWKRPVRSLIRQLSDIE